MNANYSKVLVLWFCSAASFCTPAHAQKTHRIAKTNVERAHELLRTMYPGLNDKKYFMTIEGGVQYDKPGTPMRWFDVYVGLGPKEWVMGYIGGCEGKPLPFQIPLPPEIAGQPGPTVLSPKLPPDWLRTDCKTGPIKPKQFLTAAFRFNDQDFLASFAANGLGVGDPDAEEAFLKLIGDHPEAMTQAEIVAALKKAGAKYGPEDKEDFIKNLPFARLRPFLGKLELLSVDFLPLDENRNNADFWPDWRVRAKAMRTNGTVEIYDMSFDRYRGDLTGLAISRPAP